MIRSERLNSSEDEERARIVLRADGEWRWQTNVPLIAGLTVASVLVASVTLAKGAWMVPIFSLFEIAMVVLAISVCLKRAGVQEVLTFSPLWVKFERGRHEPEETVDIERFHARFVVRYPQSRLSRPQVLLQYRRDGKGHDIRIGEFLSAEELVKLVKAIRLVIKRLET